MTSGPQDLTIRWLSLIYCSVFFFLMKELSTTYWPCMASTKSLSRCAEFLVVAEKSIEIKGGCLAGFKYEVPLSHHRTPSDTQNDIETNHNGVFFFTDSYSSRAVYVLAVALAYAEFLLASFLSDCSVSRISPLKHTDGFSQRPLKVRTIISLLKMSKKKTTTKKQDTHFGISFNGFWLVWKSVDWNGLCPLQSRWCSQVMMSVNTVEQLQKKSWHKNASRVPFPTTEWRIRCWWVLHDVALADAAGVKARSRCSGARGVGLSAQACRASCSWSRTAACPWVVSRWASCPPGARRRAARSRGMKRSAATADAARDARNGWADWGTDSLHTPPGHTETFPGCSPRGPHLTGPWHLEEAERLWLVYIRHHPGRFRDKT